ncbi:MAG TPA: hypothetical protein VFI41_05295 [Gemmatimonadales bacterium]|nr:hypothetical protein [Gemmatimonadales bacterium]
MDDIFNDRRVKPAVHPDHTMVGDPHYVDPRTVTWVEREPASGFRGAKSPRWRVQHLQANEFGGSMQRSTLPMRSRRAATSAFEMIKQGHDVGAFDRRGNLLDVDVRERQRR